MTVRVSRAERRALGKRSRRRMLAKDARQIILGHQRGNSHRAIASSVGVSEAFVARVLELARQLELIPDKAADQDEGGGGVR